MSNLLHSRVFRLLVCLILVASFLINLSPLKAEATAVVGAALTFDGLMAALYSLSIGICATAFTVDVWNKVGQTFRKVITDTGDSTITEAWVDLEAMYDAYIPGGGNDPDDELKWTEKLKTALSRGLLGAIAGWLCTLVNMGGYEVEESISNGCWSYNGLLFGPLADYDPSSYWYMILESTADTYFLVRCNLSTQSFYTYAADSTLRCNGGQFGYVKARLNYTSSLSVAGTKSSMAFISVIWSSHDLFDSAGTLVIAGSEPSLTQTSIIEPSIYVGDIPQQIQDGDKDKDNLVLPIIDPFRVIQSPNTALEDMNQLQQQLANGTTTLDQYLEQVQLQEPTIDPDPPATDPSSPSSPSDPSDPSVPDGPVQDIKPYGLDLKDYFPFCIPFDIYDFFSVLIAEPQAPQFHWELQDLSGNTYSIDVDLSPWDSFAAVFRRMQLLLFIVGLAAASRKFIKW